MALALLLAAPLPARADEGREWIYATIPFGMSAGYLYTGNWGRALLAPVGLAGLTVGGFYWGLSWGADHATWKDPVGSAVGLLTGPVGGAGLGFLAGTTVILIDQAIQPQPGGPFMAPLISIGTTAALIGIAGSGPGRPKPKEAPPAP
jgi:hypothetical protein